jgi:hypothetical protein
LSFSRKQSVVQPFMGAIVTIVYIYFCKIGIA